MFEVSRRTLGELRCEGNHTLAAALVSNLEGIQPDRQLVRKFKVFSERDRPGPKVCKGTLFLENLDSILRIGQNPNGLFGVAYDSGN
jgi:hypothetical protein